MASSPILTIAMHGAAGRMGIRILQLAAEDPGLAIGAAIERADHPRIGEDVGRLIGRAPLGIPLTSTGEGPIDVLIDFSTPAASLAIARRCQERRIPLIVGTTGFEPPQRAELESAAQAIPLLISSNFSRAVNLLMHLCGLAARTLGEAADVEIVERHHRYKTDAPSGTALRLAEVVAEAIGRKHVIYGRQGHTGERPQGQIGLHALRTGDNPGEHTVVFGLMGECLELSHRALNRDGFARGRLDAAKFLVGKPPGLYSMNEVLGVHGSATR